MKTFKLLAVATAFAAFTGTAMADEAVIHDRYAFDQSQLLPSGIRAEVGTTGYGGALLWTVNPYVGLALGYNGGDISWSDDLKINGSTYDLDMDNKLAYLNAEIRPWGASDNIWAQGLYMAAGVAYVDNDYDIDRRVNSGRYFTSGGTRFEANSDVSINGKMSYDNDIAPYVGFGFAPKFNQHWGAFAEVGAYYTGNPKVSLNATGNATPRDTADAGKTLAGSIAKEEYDIANKNKYEWLPVGKVGVNFYW